MGILDRFSTIMKANINALLDKAENPAKMIDQYLIDCKETLAEVKKETAGVMAIEKQCAKEYEDNEAEVAKYQELAKKAVSANNDDDARTFIAKYIGLEEKRAVLGRNKETAESNATRMREMHDKLAKDIKELEGRKSQIKSTVAVAKTTETLNKIGDITGKSSDVGGKFSDMQQKADKMLFEAEAKAELNQPVRDEAESLSAKYAEAAGADIEAELAKLKAGI
ncbi:MAG: PspA/IM30 family protein [Clostridiales Family XIII bacterium]|jgi:phage shock protein A|nr:PspA/IM30 family protein [Clostridiales Family XIII bacterium]